MQTKPCTSCAAALDGRCAEIAANQPYTVERMVGDTWEATITVPDAGSILPQHSHAYDHVTDLLAGAVTVYRDGDMLGRMLVAPASLLIPAHVMHTFTTHEPNTVLRCTHTVTRDGRPIEVGRNGLHLTETA